MNVLPRGVPEDLGVMNDDLSPDIRIFNSIISPRQRDLNGPMNAAKN